MTTERPAAAAAVSPEPIAQLVLGFMGSKHVFVANEIGLFERLAAGPATLDELADRTGVPRRTLRISADAMVALGLLEREGNRYRNGAAAATYLSGKGPADLRAWLRLANRISYVHWTQLEEAIRSGKAPNRQGGGFSEEDQKVFSEGVDAFSAGPAEALAAGYDFGAHRRILDLGGGTGSFLLPVLRRHTQLHGTVFELQGAAAVARRRLGSEREGSRIEVVDGDFFRDPVPGDHDAVLLVNIVHLFLPDQDRELFQRIRASVAPGTRLLIVDLLTDPSHTQPLGAALMAGEFLVIAGHGDVYSDAEVRGWLEKADWRPLETRPLVGPSSLLVAEAI